MSIGEIDGMEIDYADGVCHLPTGAVFDFRALVTYERVGRIRWASHETYAWFVAARDASVLTAEQRAARLAAAIEYYARRGARVESREATTAILVSGRPVDHLTHAIISIFTWGLWLPVWLIVALGGGEKRLFPAVDDFGELTVA